MGFFPVREVKIERDYGRPDRKLKASYFDVVMNRWHVQEFEGTEYQKAADFLVERLKEVAM